MNDTETTSENSSRTPKTRKSKAATKSRKRPKRKSVRPNADFRPNHARSVFLAGGIDQSKIASLSPSIVGLLGSNPGKPITVYIDSPGGSVFVAESLNRTLRMASQDDREPTRIITVGLNIVASAAVDFLIAGDYAILQPYSLLLCHGVRQSGDGLNVTREKANDLARSLAQSNEQYALQTARNAIGRFIFRIATLRHEFAEIRKAQPDGKMSEAACFISALEARVSPVLMTLLRQALINVLVTELTDLTASKIYTSAAEKPQTKVEFEAMLLKCIIDREVEDQKGNSQFTYRSHGLASIQAKFEVLVDSHDQSHRAQINKLIRIWGSSFLTPAQVADLAAISEGKRQVWLTKRIEPVIQSLWFFFVAVCRLLQENENYLSSEEAYWIGLVDEIAGRSDLPSPRMLVEYAELESD